MTLSAPAAISSIGDAQQVRHLRAATRSWAVWTYDEGSGSLFAVRERTGVINVISTLRTDGTEFSERIVPLTPRKVTNFHVLEISTNVVMFLYSDGTSLYQFTWNVLTNVVLTTPTLIAQGEIPSQYFDGAFVRQLYVRDRDVKVRTVGENIETTIIDPTETEAVEMDIVRKAATTLGRYAGAQSINRDLILPFRTEVTSDVCYNGTTDTVSVTEATPAGTVSYYSFDNANFSGNTLLDQVGSNNGTLVGTAATNVPSGQIAQARQFTSGVGNDYYNLGNVSALNFTGNMSLAFWIKRTTRQAYGHPIYKAYGGAYGMIIRGDLEEGRFDFYYGTSGTEAVQYQGVATDNGVLPFNAWAHAVVVRDFTTRAIKLYVNGRLFVQKTAVYTAAVAGSNNIAIGGGPSWTGYRLASQLDDMLFANQAWSPESVAATYAKGLAGARPTTSGTGSYKRLLDVSGNARHAELSVAATATPNGWGHNGAPTSLLAGGLTTYAPGAAFTIEARVLMRAGDPGEWMLYGTRELGSDITAGRLAGTFGFYYTSEGKLRFRFEASGSLVEFRQTGTTTMRFNEINTIAMVHTFGSGGGTLLVINGISVPGAWVSGSGNEALPVLAAAPTINLNTGDELWGLRVSNVAKTLTALQTYLRGRS